MSDDNDQSSSGSGGGQSLSGGASEPLPSTWSHPSQAPRVGRIGNWSNTPSTYVLLSRIRSINLIGSRSGGNPSIGRIGGLNPGPSRDDDDDDDDDDNKRESWFTGGERRSVVGDHVLVGCR